MNCSRPACVLVAGLMLFLAAARGQSSFFALDTTSSVSGQFVVSFMPDNDPYYRRPDTGTNTDWLRLEPSLLAVSAERFKTALWTQIGLAANAPWTGKIFLALHSARSLDDEVVISSAQIHGQAWNYRLELPDRALRATSVTRVRSATVLLLETGQPLQCRRSAADQAAEIPPMARGRSGAADFR
jgi:hypothetical protein